MRRPSCVAWGVRVPARLARIRGRRCHHHAASEADRSKPPVAAGREGRDGPDFFRGRRPRLRESGRQRREQELEPCAVRVGAVSFRLELPAAMPWGHFASWGTACASRDGAARPPDREAITALCAWQRGRGGVGSSRCEADEPAALGAVERGCRSRRGRDEPAVRRSISVRSGRRRCRARGGRARRRRRRFRRARRGGS
jgi:hypothetical protein